MLSKSYKLERCTLLLLKDGLTESDRLSYKITENYGSCLCFYLSKRTVPLFSIIRACSLKINAFLAHIFLCFSPKFLRQKGDGHMHLALLCSIYIV